jgi:single-stranded-DNA-specific exonuclease
VLEESVAKVEASFNPSMSLIIASGKEWHPGVIGIVASRLKDMFHRPAVVIAIDEEGIGKASARSVEGIDLGAAIVSANLSGLLLKGGGHAMAAGFSIEEHKIPELYHFLSERFKDLSIYYNQRVWTMDGYLSVKGASLDLIRDLSRAAPFGTKNSEPRFCLKQVYVVKAEPVGSDHVRIIVADTQGGKGSGSIKCMAFRCADNAIGQTLLHAGGKTLSLLGKLKRNVWQGNESVDFIIDDVAVVS